MKKKLLYVGSTSAIFCNLLTISCSSTQSQTPNIDNENYYSISFKNINSIDLKSQGYSNTFASSLSQKEIKQIIIKNKNIIFNNYQEQNDTFFTNNVSINSVIPNDKEGMLNFEIKLTNASNNPEELQKTITKKFMFSGFLKKTNQDNVILPDNPNDIPSDLPSKPGISEEEKKWGNVLLPKIPDEQIKIDDLVDMMDQHIGNINFVNVTFGERKIDATLMANAFAKWITTRFKYFPYFAFSNPVFKIAIKDESGQEISWKGSNWNNPETMNKKYYVHSLTTYKGAIFDYYADKWLFQGFYKDSFINFVSDFLNLISYDMKGIDKAITAYFYVANYLNYSDSSSIEATIVNRNGVCADYASLMSLLCNIAGVPALPMVTSHNNINYTSMHEIVWVYIDDLYNANEKKWYAMDPTFAYGRGGSYNGPISFWPSNLNIENVLFNFSSDPYQNYPSDEHYNSNLFFNAPWKTLYENNSLETREIPNNFLNIKNKSNPVYYDGYWYYYCYDETGNKLVRSKFVTPNNSQKYEIVIDFTNPENPDPNKFGFNIDSEICDLFKKFSTSSFKYHSYGYNEKIILCTNIKKTEFDNSVKFLIIDLKTKQYKLIKQTFDIRSASLKTSFNFYVKDGDIYYTSNPINETSWRKKTYSKLELTEEEHDFLNSSSDNKTKLWRKILLYRTTAGTYLTGTDDPINKVSTSSKRDFMEYLNILENKIKNNQISNFDITIKELEDKYNSFIPKIKNEGIIKMNELNDLYQYEKSYVDAIDALPLNKLILIDNFSDFSSNNNNIAFDIYYSPTKNGTFKKVREELYLDSTGINVRLSDVGGDYNGFYYFEYYPYGLSNQKSKTKIFEIQIVETKNVPDYEGLWSQSRNNTNYYVSSNNWYDNKIALNITLNNMLYVKNEVFLDLKYVNPENNKIITLDSITINNNNSSSFAKKWVIDKPSNNNHGIYWVEYRTNLDNKTYKFYSNFFYHFTKNDVDNFNIKKWADLSNLIK